uniref:Si:ch73-23l24.1 n=1 Tax=Hucho hucho TaxID=62062 RepID=A0A4W5MWC9_9TELE
KHTSSDWFPFDVLFSSRALVGFPAADVGREKRSMPNWALTSSDFFGWVEALREHAGYEKIEDLSRTFWAHFPSASRLGYELSDPDEE